MPDEGERILWEALLEGPPDVEPAWGHWNYDVEFGYYVYPDYPHIRATRDWLMHLPQNRSSRWYAVAVRIAMEQPGIQFDELAQRTDRELDLETFERLSRLVVQPVTPQRRPRRVRNNNTRGRGLCIERQRTPPCSRDCPCHEARFQAARERMEG